MVAQLTGNFAATAYGRGLPARPCCLGDAVYTMPETLSLILCYGLVSRAMLTLRSPLSALNPGLHDAKDHFRAEAR
jgi:hypothetical protein